MGTARTKSPGGATIETWTVHCPDCGTALTVAGEAVAVACTKCSTVFHPGGVPTVAPRRAGADAPRDPEDSLVGTTLGPWRLERMLGRGGMGRVYEARDTRSERKAKTVALKVLPQDLAEDPSFVRRFHRESKVLGSLSHPHVVEVIDGGEHAGRLWFAMEYVRGENLRRRIERGPLEPAEAGRIASEIASALAYAHGRGVVHRDLKPENVLLDEEGRVHLADFGLSRLVRDGGHEASTHLTRTDVILGTYEYMAPEQRRGAKDVDGRADVFALGVILYEMLTGSLPLGRFAPASQVVHGVPAAFDAVVNRALAPDPAARHATASDFRDAVLAAAKGAGSGKKSVPAPLPADTQEILEARRVLTHVDILAGLDRALGVLLLLGCFGLVAVGKILGAAYDILPFGAAALLIGAIVFLRLGGRVADVRSGARESQITASIVLLFFPPFLTAMGIYGLWAMSSERARRAFALGRKNLALPAPVVRPVPVAKEPLRQGPGVLLRLLLLASVFWTIWMGLLVLDTNVFTPATTTRHLDNALRGTQVALLGSSLILAWTWFTRRTRRGLGIALVSWMLLLVSLGLVENARDLPRDGPARVLTPPR